MQRSDCSLHCMSLPYIVTNVTNKGFFLIFIETHPTTHAEEGHYIPTQEACTINYITHTCVHTVKSTAVNGSMAMWVLRRRCECPTC